MCQNNWQFLFPFFCFSLIITVIANEWPGDSVTKIVELLDAVFPKESLVTVAKACNTQAEERIAQLEEAKQNAMQLLPSSSLFAHHSAELQRTVKAKAADHFYTHMREQYNAEGEEKILQEYVSPFSDCAADCAQLMQNMAHAHYELSTLQAEEQEQQKHNSKQSNDKLLTEANMELDALEVALHSVQLTLQRLGERHERNTDWLMPSLFNIMNTLRAFSLRNAMAAEMERHKSRRGDNFWKPIGGGKAKYDQWENIPLK